MKLTNRKSIFLFLCAAILMAWVLGPRIHAQAVINSSDTVNVTTTVKGNNGNPNGNTTNNINALVCNETTSATSGTNAQMGALSCRASDLGLRIIVKDGAGNDRYLNVDSSGQIATTHASGSVASGAFASGSIASGAFAAGSLNSAIPDVCFTSAKTFVPISISAAATTVEIAASSSNKAYICNLFLIASAADNVALVEDASGSCASPDAGMSGGTTSGTGWNLAANEGFTWGTGLATVGKTASTNVNVCLITSSAAQLSGTLAYVLAP